MRRKLYLFWSKKGIFMKLRSMKRKLGDLTIQLKVNIDGIQLFKSSTASLWPILCSFNSFSPFVVSIYYGLKKPDPIEEYLSDFLNELNELLQNGVIFNGKKILVNMYAFVCDAPARQHLKCIESHTGYFCCERCIIKGYRSNNQIVYYAQEESRKRLDVHFNNFKYKNGDEPINDGHQLKLSPLAGLISCINDFPLDYMHLVCLGVMRVMFYFWKKGSKTSLKCKIKLSQFIRLSESLEKFSNAMPSEFARKPRGTIYFEKWKATEFRQFLLYTGPVVLKSSVDKAYYSHFLCLSVAMTILLNGCVSFRNKYLTYAKNLLKHFVVESKKLYTDLFISYNVHNLIHLVSDSEYFGVNLDEISAFEFENYLQVLKRRVRSGYNPIAQIVKRVSEAETFEPDTLSTKTLQKIGLKAPDNVFLLDRKRYVFVCHIQENDNFLCSSVTFDVCENFYPEPFNSKLCFVSFCKLNLISKAKKVIVHKDQLISKVCCLPYKDGYVLFPMLHSSG